MWSSLTISGTEIGEVTAFDFEGDPLTYSLETTTEDAGFFRINSTSGVLTTFRTIDREVSMVHQCS